MQCLTVVSELQLQNLILSSQVIKTRFHAHLMEKWANPRALDLALRVPKSLASSRAQPRRDAQWG